MYSWDHREVMWSWRPQKRQGTKPIPLTKLYNKGHYVKKTCNSEDSALQAFFSAFLSRSQVGCIRALKFIALSWSLTTIFVDNWTSIPQVPQSTTTYSDFCLDIPVLEERKHTRERNTLSRAREKIGSRDFHVKNEMTRWKCLTRARGYSKFKSGRTFDHTWSFCKGG